jgi:DNA-binding FadR family transcriptional regulator
MRPDVERTFPTDSPAVIRARVAASGLNTRQRARAMQDEIHAHFRTAILTGMFARGDLLPPERSLAAEFGANRRTVQAALAGLERDGLIARRRGSGSHVIWSAAHPAPGRVFPTPSVSPLDAFEVRLVIEPHVCGLVVARATEEDFARMEARLQEMETAPDQVAYREAGYAFYLDVVRATRNPLLVSMYEMLVAARAKAGWGTLIPLNDRSEQRDAQIAANRSIHAALRRRDAATARSLCIYHLTEMIRTAASFPLQA